MNHTYIINPDLTCAPWSTAYHNHDRVYLKRADRTELKDADIVAAASGWGRDSQNYRIISRDTFTALIERDHYIGE